MTCSNFNSLLLGANRNTLSRKAFDWSLRFLLMKTDGMIATALSEKVELKKATISEYDLVRFGVQAPSRSIREGETCLFSTK
jgi:NADH:ubiquinone oxidoreductase subunit B-like Fe-S oxidoreductase